jgi:flavocytochrome c
LFFNDQMKAGEGWNDPEIVRIHAENTPDLYKWLVARGAKFDRLMVRAGMSALRVHYCDPVQVVRVVKEDCDKKGIQFLNETPCQELLILPDGRVTGVIAERRGKKIYIKARKGVVIATGGFCHNAEMMKNYGGVGLDRCVKSPPPTHTGDGLQMALQLGAKTVAMAIGTRGSSPKHPTGGNSMREAFYGAVAVNKNGVRFGDESLDAHDFGSEIQIKQPDALGWYIFDLKIKAETKVKEPHLHKDGDKFAVVADTIEELARKIKVLPEKLKATIDKYNSDIDAHGFDTAFGRKYLQGTHGRPVKIDTPPFLAYESYPSILSTKGGIKINPKCQVVDMYDRVIPGLYAAGEVSGGMFGLKTLGGLAVTRGWIQGRIAGKNAAAEKPGGKGKD